MADIESLFPNRLKLEAKSLESYGQDGAPPWVEFKKLRGRQYIKLVKQALPLIQKFASADTEKLNAENTSVVLQIFDSIPEDLYEKIEAILKDRIVGWSEVFGDFNKDGVKDEKAVAFFIEEFVSPGFIFEAVVALLNFTSEGQAPSKNV